MEIFILVGKKNTNGLGGVLSFVTQLAILRKNLSAWITSPRFTQVSALPGLQGLGREIALQPPQPEPGM